jgi:hypothetical protein
MQMTSSEAKKNPTETLRREYNSMSSKTKANHLTIGCPSDNERNVHELQKKRARGQVIVIERLNKALLI